MGNERKTLTKTELSEVYRKARKDYMPDFSPFREVGDRAELMRRRMATRLTETERTTLILYAELGSLQKLADQMNVSKSRINREIQEIKRKLL